MQSYRKNPTSLYLGKQSNPSVRAQSKPIGGVKKKSSVSIQTENLPGFGGLCNFNSMPLKEIKEHYQGTLRFLNKCHSFINSVFVGEVEHLKPARRTEFRIPEVPDYFGILELILGEGRAPALIEEPVVHKPKTLPDDDENVVFDLKQFLPHGKCAENVSEEDKLVENLDGRRVASPSRTVKSEDLLKRPSRSNMKSISSTFEEILKTCTEFESKSIEFLLRNDVPLNEPPSTPRHFELTPDVSLPGNGECGDEGEKHSKIHQEFFENLRQMRDMNPSNPNREFNFFEYSSRSRTQSNLTSRSSSNQSLRTEVKPQITSSQLIDLQRLVANVRRSVTVLNQAPQCQSPKKVNELFEKISKENLKYNEDQKGEIEISSCESIILTDEEFHKKHFRSTVEWGSNREMTNTQEHQNLEQPSRALSYSHVKTKSGNEDPHLKSNPLMLNEKDKSKADQKILRAIGLFTDKGEIRPGVINLIEEKRRLSLAQNKSKNVKFRTERRFDVEVRFNNKNMRTTPDNTSEESLASVIRSPRGEGSDRISVSSASTISESDLINVKSQDDNLIIKK